MYIVPSDSFFYFPSFFALLFTQPEELYLRPKFRSSFLVTSYSIEHLVDLSITDNVRPTTSLLFENILWPLKNA